MREKFGPPACLLARAILLAGMREMGIKTLTG